MHLENNNNNNNVGQNATSLMNKNSLKFWIIVGLIRMIVGVLMMLPSYECNELIRYLFLTFIVHDFLIVVLGRKFLIYKRKLEPQLNEQISSFWFIRFLFGENVEI